MIDTSSRHPLRAVLAAAFALTLSACAPGDVALEGKVFDAIGVAGTQQGGGRHVRLADRAPLVVPPDASRLPAPGETGSTGDDVLAAIDDPDRKKVQTRSELEKKQAEYCRVNYELAKARGDNGTADTAVGPLGSCKPSIFSAIKNWNKSDDE